MSEVLPPGWAWATLDQLQAPEPRAITDGPFGSNLKSAHYTVDGARVIRLQNVGDGEFRDERAYISLDHYEALKNHNARAGDLVFASLGQILPRVALVPDLDGPAIVKADVIRIRLHPDLNTKWVLYALQAPQTRAVAMSKIKGVGRPRLGLGEIRKLPIPIPPLSEQNRIVEVLEDHLSRLDAGCSIIYSNLDKCRVLEAAVIDQAVRGTLLKYDSVIKVAEYEDALYERRTSLVRGRNSTAIVASSPVAMAVPENWTVRSVSELTWNIEYGTSAKAHDEPSLGDVPVVRMGNIQNRELDLASLKYLPADHPDIQRLTLSPGDLLFNRTNSAELVGKSAVFSGHPPLMTFASYLIRCRMLPGVEPDWVNLVINSPVGRSYLKSVVSQQVGQANINGTKLAAMPIPLPTQDEQRAILDVVGEYLQQHRRLVEALNKALARAEHLRSSLLAEAFAGRLVDQDKRDMPAEESLAKVIAERDPPAKRRTQRTRISASPEHVIQEELPL